MRAPDRRLFAEHGHGIHKCPGEHLGNLEGRVILEELLGAVGPYEVGRLYGEFLCGYVRVPIGVSSAR